ncbi:cation acetate symporter [Streptomyces sp. TM32]|uniref:solute symporter family protein n=1 Tax=Streptomyces sp. TM32 TaxID=1652669 RepID=UPI00101343D6|nr:cation acetate symporter [Streptomyces sp. TM32]RXS88404.1 cation acetate symporter [Streptomyces sp. TM32]
MTSTTHHYAVLVVFTFFVVGALFLSVWAASYRDTTSDFYIGGGRLTSTRNGLALFGDYMSAAALLGNPGVLALRGYDGIPYVLGPAVAWAVIGLLVAERFHATGRFTVGDSLADRLRPRAAHLAGGVATVVVCLMYLIAQLVAAGALAAPVLGVHGAPAERIVIVGLGSLMILYVVLGGMPATTVVQCVKAVLMLAGGTVAALMVLARFHWNPGALLSAAAHRSGHGAAFLRPGVSLGSTAASSLDFLSLQLTMVLGAAGLPHLLMRLHTVPTARDVRRSVRRATTLICSFALISVVLGLGAVAVLGSHRISGDSPSGNTAVLLLASELGGSFLVTLISCVAFATILAVVAGVTLTAATALAHDLYGGVLVRGTASQRRELVVARSAVLLTGGTATALALFARDLSISFLIGLAFAVAASAILPAVLYRLYWPGFTTKGANWSVYGGLLSCLLLIVLSPQVSGSPSALLPQADFAAFPLRNPGLVTIPVGFFLGWLGSLRERRQGGLPR